MGRIYSAAIDAVSVSAVQDLFKLVAASNVAVKVREIVIVQTTDFGDAEAEQLQVKIHRGTGGSGGTSVTPQPLDPSYPAADTTATRNQTTQATESNLLRADGWTIQAPYYYIPVPEDRITIPGGGTLIIELSAPADAITVSATVVFEEIG